MPCHDMACLMAQHSRQLVLDIDGLEQASEHDHLCRRRRWVGVLSMQLDSRPCGQLTRWTPAGVQGRTLPPGSTMALTLSLFMTANSHSRFCRACVEMSLGACMAQGTKYGTEPHLEVFLVSAAVLVCEHDNFKEGSKG